MAGFVKRAPACEVLPAELNRGQFFERVVDVVLETVDAYLLGLGECPHIPGEVVPVNGVLVSPLRRSRNEVPLPSDSKSIRY